MIYLIPWNTLMHIFYCAACAVTLNWTCTHRFEYILPIQLQQDVPSYISLHCSWRYANVLAPHIPTLNPSQDYTMTQPSSKTWDFPKMHSHIHMFHDIEEKGVTRNYNTKPSESMHGQLKTSYKLRTNFKDVGRQVGGKIVIFPFRFISCFADPKSWSHVPCVHPYSQPDWWSRRKGYWQHWQGWRGDTWAWFAGSSSASMHIPELRRNACWR